jgi:hypothetical protein
MPTQISQTPSWLDLISYVVRRRYPVAVGELMEPSPAYAQQKPATARQYLERDQDDLTALGIPVQYIRGDEENESAELQGVDDLLARDRRRLGRGIVECLHVIRHERQQAGAEEPWLRAGSSVVQLAGVRRRAG